MRQPECNISKLVQEVRKVISVLNGSDRTVRPSQQVRCERGMNQGVHFGKVMAQLGTSMRNGR